MNQSTLEKFDFSMLVPALTSGLGDSINPCNFATLLIFIIILSHIAYTPLRIIILGGLFIGLAGGVQWLSVTGLWDQLLTAKIILDAMRIGYLLIAAAFLFLGIMHILDWWRYKREHDTNCFKLQLPVFFRNKSENSPLKFWKKVLAFMSNVSLIFVAAIFMSFIGAVYPQSEYMYIVHSFLVSGGGREFARQSFGLYSLAMVLPLIITWFVILFLALWKKRGAKIISYYKGILSALFISTGLGLGYFFLN